MKDIIILFSVTMIGLIGCYVAMFEPQLIIQLIRIGE